jgi:hypothetical protein
LLMKFYNLFSAVGIDLAGSWGCNWVRSTRSNGRICWGYSMVINFLFRSRSVFELTYWYCKFWTLLIFVNIWKGNIALLQFYPLDESLKGVTFSDVILMPFICISLFNFKCKNVICTVDEQFSNSTPLATESISWFGRQFAETGCKWFNRFKK